MTNASGYECPRCFQWVTSPNHVCYAADPRKRGAATERARLQAERDALKADNDRHKQAVLALTAELAQVKADLKPLHDAMQSSKYLAESWGQNVCEWAAKELIELRADNLNLWRAADWLLKQTDDLCDCWRPEIVRPKDGGVDMASSNMEHNHLTHEAIADLRAALAGSAPTGTPNPAEME